MLQNTKILVTGPTSQVGRPVVAALSGDNEVWGLARFSKPDDRAGIEALGAKTVAVDLADGALDEVPTDFDYVLHFAVVKSGDFAYDLRANAEGVGRLIAHCKSARAFLHCSTGGVYQPAGHTPLKETDPLGDNHLVMLPTYSISKIAAESVARFAAREWNLPTTIARFSVPYGNNGGWPFYHLMMMKAGVPIPVHPDKPSLYNLTHEDDYIAMIPRMLEIADVPATTINWCGSESTSIEDYTENTLPSVALDPTLMHERIGRTKVDWRDGLHRMVEALAPDLLKS